MEALAKRLDEIDARLRLVEQNGSSITSTLTHFTTTVDNFIETLKTHEQKEDVRFEKFEKKLETLTKVAYIGLGALTVIQFLISNKILIFGGA